MLEIILDTETTGLSTLENHRIVEIGCIELKDQIPTNKIFHQYLNPERSISEEAFKIHGYSDKFLSDKKFFAEIADEFLEFISNKKNIIDTLEIARKRFPGSQNSIDALCKRFRIDNSKREKHNALLDCNLLKEIYINLLDQKEPKLNLKNNDIANLDPNDQYLVSKNGKRKIVKPNSEELDLHAKFLKDNLQKNFYD